MVVLYYKDAFYSSIQISELTSFLLNKLSVKSLSNAQLYKSINISSIIYQRNSYPSDHEVWMTIIDNLLGSLQVYSISPTPICNDDIMSSVDRGTNYKGIISMLSTNQKYLLSRSMYVCIQVPTGLLSWGNHDIIYYSSFEIMKMERTIDTVALRDYQLQTCNDIHEIIQSSLSKSTPISLNLGFPCGYGKTWVSLYLMSKFNLKTLVCCPTILIARQWMHVFESHFGKSSSIKYYMSGRGVSHLLNLDIIEKCDILICVDKHLLSDEFCVLARKNFSMFILDESHNNKFTANSSIASTLCSFTFLISIYLSGTPRAENVFITGPNFVDETMFSMCNGIIKVLTNTTKPTVKDMALVHARIKPYKDKLIEYNMFVNTIDRLETRNEYICSEIPSLMGKDTKMLILCELVMQTKTLYAGLRESSEYNIHLVERGNTGLQRLEEFVSGKENSSYIIIATIDLCSKGMDIKNLNTLVVANTGIENLSIRQASGRILREQSDQVKTIYFIKQSCGLSVIDSFSNARINIGVGLLNEEGWRLM